MLEFKNKLLWPFCEVTMLHSGVFLVFFKPIIIRIRCTKMTDQSLWAIIFVNAVTA